MRHGNCFEFARFNFSTEEQGFSSRPARRPMSQQAAAVGFYSQVRRVELQYSPPRRGMDATSIRCREGMEPPAMMTIIFTLISFRFRSNGYPRWFEPIQLKPCRFHARATSSHVDRVPICEPASVRSEYMSKDWRLPACNSVQWSVGFMANVATLAMWIL
jgi:hypothetical protein